MTHRDLIVFVPSRGRPHAVAELAKAWDDTDTTAALLVRVDDDDPTLQPYRAAAEVLGVRLEVGPRLRLGPTLNQLVADHAHECDAVGFLGDDHRPRVSGWDRMLLAALDATGVGIAYGDDLFQREKLPTAVVMSSAIPILVGHMVPPGLIHMYLDDYWAALGHGADCLTYVPQAVIEHVHPHAGKAQPDAGYEEVWPLMGPDAERWQQYQASGGLARDIAIVRGLRG